MLQHQSPYKKSSSSLVVKAKFHMKFPPDNMQIYHFYDRRYAWGHTAGLIYFSGMSFKEDYYGVPVICNPNTGQYLTLPYLLRYRKSYSFFGFDPIDKQFKTLFMAYPGCSDNHKILTLGTGKMRWRTITCPLPHHPLSEGLCINGVLYYLGAYQGHVKYVLVCFDVRSEKFKFIYIQNFCTLINYKGKLCVVYWEDAGVCYKDHVDAIELRVWVLEDAEKQEWSKSAYTLRDDKFFVGERYYCVVVAGVTGMGEIIVSMRYYTSNQRFCVFYFNPEKNTLQRVEIQGFGECDHNAFRKRSVYTFVDHVEDLIVNDAKLLNSSIYAPYVKTQDEEEEDDDDDEGEEDRDELS